MLYDVRTYECRPGTIKMHLDLYENTEAHNPGIRKSLAYMSVKPGILTATFISTYENAADREERRKKMVADPEWQNYLKLSREAGYLILQENQLMQNVDFYPHSKPDRIIPNRNFIHQQF